MKTKKLGTITNEGIYNILNEDDDIVLETIDENGNIILNYIDNDD